MNTVEINNSPTANMSLDEIVRWTCLVEAIQVADAQMKYLGIDPEKFDWVKPVALEKYIAERFHSLKSDIVYELKNGIEDATEEEIFFKS